jgi:hypothetical protein
VGCGVRKGAKLSEDGAYRYVLWRDWRDAVTEPLLGYVMLNPSTANANVDDQTIRKCVGFAEHNGYRGFIVLNLFAYRATDPKDLERAHRRGADIVGPENRYWHHVYLPLMERTVAAWGAHRLAPYGVDEMSHLWHSAFYCLGVTRNGAPRHPCYIGYQALQPFASPWRETAA